MYTCVCAYACVCVCIYACVCVRVCVYVYVYVYVHVYVCVRERESVHGDALRIPCIRYKCRAHVHVSASLYNGNKGNAFVQICLC